MVLQEISSISFHCNVTNQMKSGSLLLVTVMIQSLLMDWEEQIKHCPASLIGEQLQTTWNFPIWLWILYFPCQGMFYIIWPKNKNKDFKKFNMSTVPRTCVGKFLKEAILCWCIAVVICYLLVIFSFPAIVCMYYDTRQKWKWYTSE